TYRRHGSPTDTLKGTRGRILVPPPVIRIHDEKTAVRCLVTPRWRRLRFEVLPWTIHRGQRVLRDEPTVASGGGDQEQSIKVDSGLALPGDVKGCRVRTMNPHCHKGGEISSPW